MAGAPYLGGRLEAPLTCDKAHPKVSSQVFWRFRIQGGEVQIQAVVQVERCALAVLSELGSVASGLIIEARGLGVCNLGSGLVLRASSRS